MSDSHGNTPAAWTAVVIGLIGFAVASVGIMILPGTTAWTIFWIGVVLTIAAIPVMIVMAKLGFHVERH